MSDKEISAPKKGLDRRAVVKGAAWTLPVVAAAIAAPAASASTQAALTAFTGTSSGLAWFSLSSGVGTSVAGTGPTALTVQNNPGAIPGNITGTITISQNPGLSLLGQPKGIGVASITGAAINSRTASGGSGGIAGIGAIADTTVTTFTYTAGVASSGLLSLPITFGFTDSGAFLSVSLAKNYTATLVLRDGNGVQIGATATAPLSSLLDASVV